MKLTSTHKFVLLGVTVIAAWALTPFGLGLFADNDNSRATLAAQFDAVTALFSGLAFVGLIAAIWLQREELALQREELRLTREEMAKSVEAQQSSSAALQETLSQERLLTKKRLTVELYMRWNSEEMVVTWEEARKMAMVMPAAPGRTLSALIGTHLTDVNRLTDLVAFFEMCARLKAAGELDDDLYMSLMDGNLWAANAVFDKVFPAGGGRYDLDQTLSLIETHLINPAIARMR